MLFLYFRKALGHRILRRMEASPDYIRPCENAKLDDGTQFKEIANLMEEAQSENWIEVDLLKIYPYDLERRLFRRNWKDITRKPIKFFSSMKDVMRRWRRRPLLKRSKTGISICVDVCCGFFTALDFQVVFWTPRTARDLQVGYLPVTYIGSVSEIGISWNPLLAAKRVGNVCGKKNFPRFCRHCRSIWTPAPESNTFPVHCVHCNVSAILFTVAGPIWIVQIWALRSTLFLEW